MKCGNDSYPTRKGDKIKNGENIPIRLISRPSVRTISITFRISKL